MRGGLVLLVLAAMLIGGCAQAAQKAVESATGVQTNSNGGTITLKGQDGEKVTISSQMSDELKNFPVPDGFKLDSSASLASSGGNAALASWKGNGTLDSVASFYKKTMPARGWKEEAEFTSDSGSMLTFSKGAQESITIVTSKDDAGISISVMQGKTTATPTPNPAGATNSSSTAGSSGSSSTNSSRSVTPTAPAAVASPTAAAPEVTSSSALPDELKSLPVPDGFSVEKGSAGRLTSGGKLLSARAVLFGKTDVQKVGDFYRQGLPAKGWTEAQFVQSEDTVVGVFTNKSQGLQLMVGIDKGDAGTEVSLQVIPDSSK